MLGRMALGGGLAAAAVGLAAWAWRRRLCSRRPHPPLLDPSTGATLGKEELMRLRRGHFCAAQTVSYANTDPLLAMRGREHWLFDESGLDYLDTRNNVCHVGHANPAVARAVSLQVGTLNTNTRYLHPTVCLLARRLLETMPEPLRSGVVFFVNSGSEANDLALRLARAHTGRRGAVAVAHGYHGHTVGALGVSPYKYDSAKAHVTGGRPAWTRTVPAPDVYRGPHRGPDAAQRYAAYVADACAELAACAAASADGAGGGERGVAAFFVESGMSVAGVIVPPDGYLRACYAAVRAAGGVCVADEVQTGLGRVGAPHWWAFELEAGAVPDVVTVGKPLGNGMPVAAVVCAREIADSFARGPEYFNTFGGNPVCAAAALAVLEQIECCQLRERAARVGSHLRARLCALAAQPHAQLVGEVRGRGMFVGIDLVRDRATREPATAETSWLCSRLKQHHRILTSVDGPADNVLVLKPPLTFAEPDVDAFVRALDAQLRELARVESSELSARGHTPT